MNIIVTIKQVTDPNLPPDHLTLDAECRRVVPPFGIPPVINGYDANALEEALRLKAAHGGRVTAVGLGEDNARDALKRAVAMGADAAVLLSDPVWAEADAALTGRALAAAIRKAGACDLVLCGRQASDTDGGQVLHWIAASLGLPSVTPVTKIEAVEQGSLVVHRLVEDGYQRIRVGLPALLGISSEINEPRLPPARGIMAAGRTMIPVWRSAQLDGGPVPPPRVVLRQLRVPERSAAAERIGGGSDEDKGVALADKLRELGLI